MHNRTVALSDEESFARAHKDAVSVRNGITSDTFCTADWLRFADALERLLSRRSSAA
jgi:hypothetical protein